MGSDTKVDSQLLLSGSAEKVVELRGRNADDEPGVSTVAPAKPGPRKKAKSKPPNPSRTRKDTPKSERATAASVVPAGHRLSAAHRLRKGKAFRDQVPRKAHGSWKRAKEKVDPLQILHASDKGRLRRLLPIRYGRMLQSPFTFYRGAAAVMAADLALTPSTGVRVQACGDCHLLNFGGFATPERNILFDINDFDETLPAPWEWDVKRLVTSFVLAARSNGFSDSDGRDAAVICARSYRKRLRGYSQMSPLEVWYSQVTADDLANLVTGPLAKARLQQRIAKASAQSSSDVAYPQLTGMVGGRILIHDTLPLIFHPDHMSPEAFQDLLRENLSSYRETLTDDRRSLLDRYHLVDGAVKVVGIGSVGTACLVILMMSAANEPLFLQWKEARQSVLEPYAGKSAYPHHGQRVVMGQRLVQPATDMFLGWLTGKLGRHGYVRQLRDAKIKPLVEAMDEDLLRQYAKACGWVLARAHAKAGDVLPISGYLGGQDSFDEAMGNFAVLYADQTERDHAALKAAVRAGKVEVHLEE